MTERGTVRMPPFHRQVLAYLAEKGWTAIATGPIRIESTGKRRRLVIEFIGSKNALPSRRRQP